ncbi:MAG: hypothetical protein KKF67_01250 [Nanoarchaeota archaeon]|nr:hypothetical protein [Nanoarchaeota archaeon]
MGFEYNQITNACLWTDISLIGMVFYVARDIYKSKLFVYELDKRFSSHNNLSKRPRFRKVLINLLRSEVTWKF